MKINRGKQQQTGRAVIALVLILSVSTTAFAQEVNPAKETITPKKEYSPFVHYDFPTRVFFGDTHVYTSWSTYNRVDQLPLLTDQLSGQTNHLFSKALQESGLWQDPEEEGPFTVFVPVDQAIENLSGVSFDELSPAALKQLVSSHIIMSKFFVRNLMELERLETLNGQVLQVELTNGKIRINQSRLLLKDTEAHNGVIHFIYPAITPEEWGER
jgi:hypothetical protein